MSAKTQCPPVTIDADFYDLLLRRAHLEHVLLMAIRRETADVASRSHWTLRGKLQRLQTLAGGIWETGQEDLAADHPTRGVSVLDVTDYDDYGAPTVRLPKDED